MQYLKATARLLPEKEEGSPIEQIERAARLCYKSEGKITAGFAEELVSFLIKKHHNAMLEFGPNIVMAVPYNKMAAIIWESIDRAAEPDFYPLHYLRISPQQVEWDNEDEAAIWLSGSIRAFRDLCANYKSAAILITSLKEYLGSTLIPYSVSEFNSQRHCQGHVILNYLKDMVPYEQELHHTATVHFLCDRGVSHEIVRHRPASYAQESTRYVRYGDGITVIQPPFFEDNTEGQTLWDNALAEAETAYLQLLDNKHSPQEARSVLPNSTKTEVLMKATLREWRHFFYQRAAPTAHPQMQELAYPLLEKFRWRFPNNFDDLEGAK